MSRSVAVLVALSLPLLAACGGDGSDPASGSSPTSSAEFGTKDLDTAVNAGQEYADRYTSGDYEGAYELSANETRDAWSSQEFVAIQGACYQGDGMPLGVEGVRVSGDKAIVRLTVGEFKDSATMLYEEGGWRMEPSEDARARMGKSVADVKAECAEEP